MKTSDFKVRQRVAYVPLHADGDVSHPDTELGFVSSVGEKNVFVKFDDQLEKLGWDGTTSQACDPNSLYIL